MEQVKPTPRGIPHGFVFVLERLCKEIVFGCQMCGQCILKSTAYVCPTRCPKRLRNGSCGGYDVGGKCEVYPERDCVWCKIYRRADLLRRTETLRELKPPIDYGLFRTSSWYNLLRGNIDWPGHSQRRQTETEG
ncbi:MAG: methylenetetrahydrofolate reductase C-terminal domain-containing protein [Armatimonadota bacterium]|jgi:hypothetical protein